MPPVNDEIIKSAKKLKGKSITGDLGGLVLNFFNAISFLLIASKFNLVPLKNIGLSFSAFSIVL